jgi:hypothetical protein
MTPRSLYPPHGPEDYEKFCLKTLCRCVGSRPLQPYKPNKHHGANLARTFDQSLTSPASFLTSQRRIGVPSPSPGFRKKRAAFEEDEEDEVCPVWLSWSSFRPGWAACRPVRNFCACGLKSSRGGSSSADNGFSGGCVRSIG